MRKEKYYLPKLEKFDLFQIKLVSSIDGKEWSLHDIYLKHQITQIEAYHNDIKVCQFVKEDANWKVEFTDDKFERELKINKIIEN